MNYKSVMPIWIAFLLLVSVFIANLNSANAPDIHTWEMQEIVLQAEGKYENFYTDVTCWIDLTGPEFSKRIYGFWDGANIFKVRFVA
ncbi:MAG TPA: DUF5060 domain-containing protein, partial [Candidatus Marinimicrobia bacterium]|nr:DUF5060 domain-containing protein [Candidatus Neomarinimicrobiota bacterium]